MVWVGGLPVAHARASLAASVTGNAAFSRTKSSLASQQKKRQEVKVRSQWGSIGAHHQWSRWVWFQAIHVEDIRIESRRVRVHYHQFGSLLIRIVIQLDDTRERPLGLSLKSLWDCSLVDSITVSSFDLVIDLHQSLSVWLTGSDAKVFGAIKLSEIIAYSSFLAKRGWCHLKRKTTLFKPLIHANTLTFLILLKSAINAFFSVRFRTFYPIIRCHAVRCVVVSPNWTIVPNGAVPHELHYSLCTSTNRISRYHCSFHLVHYDLSRFLHISREPFSKDKALYSPQRELKKAIYSYMF